jgi:hypothetical protein
LKIQFLTNYFSKNKSIKNEEDEIEKKVIKSLYRIKKSIVDIDPMSVKWGGEKDEILDIISFMGPGIDAGKIPLNLNFHGSILRNEKNIYTACYNEYKEKFENDFYKLVMGKELIKLVDIIESVENKDKFTFLLNNYEISLLTAANSIEEYLGRYGKLTKEIENKLYSIMKTFIEDFNEKKAYYDELERLENQAVDYSIKERLGMELEYLNKYVREIAKIEVIKQLETKVEVVEPLKLKVKTNVESKTGEEILVKINDLFNAIKHIDPLFNQDLKGVKIKDSIHFFASEEEMSRIPLKYIERRNMIHGDVYSWNVPISEYEKVFESNFIRLIKSELPFVLKVFSLKGSILRHEKFLVQCEPAIQKICNMIDECIYINGEIDENTFIIAADIMKCIINDFKVEISRFSNEITKELKENMNKTKK